jgi:CubicO group peptidase (beta-lactamase class C family)
VTTDRFGANGMNAVGAIGWGGAYGTLYRVDPEAQLVIVLMTQLLPNTTDIRERFPTLIYQALVEMPAKAAGTDASHRDSALSASRTYKCHKYRYL